MYHVSAQSCNALTNVSFFMFSFVTLCASHTAFSTNQNWSRFSFPIHLNTGNFIALAIWNGGGGGGVGGYGGDGGETGCSVGGGGMHGICRLIRLIMLLEETFTSSSSLSHEGEIKGNSLLLPFL